MDNDNLELIDFYDFLKTCPANMLDISIADAGYDFIRYMLDLGYELEIIRDRIYIRHNTKALVKLIWYILDRLDEFNYNSIQEVLEVRYKGDIDVMLEEIEEHVQEYKMDTLGEIVEAFREEWTPTVEEGRQAVNIRHQEYRDSLPDDERRQTNY